MDCEVACSQSLLHFAFDGRHLEDFIQIVDVQNLQWLTGLLPGVVVDLLNELITRIIAYFLEELTEQMSKQRTSRDHALVRICITVIQRDVLAVGQKQPTNHRAHQHRSAGVQHRGRSGFPRKLDVRQKLGREQMLDICTLVLLVSSVLEVVGQVSNSIVLCEDTHLGRISERCTQQLDM